VTKTFSCWFASFFLTNTLKVWAKLVFCICFCLICQNCRFGFYCYFCSYGPVFGMLRLILIVRVTSLWRNILAPIRQTPAATTVLKSTIYKREDGRFWIRNVSKDKICVMIMGAIPWATGGTRLPLFQTVGI